MKNPFLFKFSRLPELIIIGLLLFLIALFSVQNMQNGHGWGDDFAMYIHHAKNITEGKAYSETGYIFNDLAPTYSPDHYPPGFPLILSVVYAIWGLNYDAMHAVLIFFLIWFLWLIYVLLKNKLPFTFIALIIALIGFSPGAWGLNDEIVSDLPAACFVLLFFYVLEKRELLSKGKFILLSAFVAYISYSIRASGVLLIPSAILVSFIRNKKADRQLFFSLLIFAGLAFIQSVVTGGGKGYFYMLQHGYMHKGNLVDYWFDIANNYLNAFKYLTYYGDGEHTPVNMFFGNLLFVLFVCGFYLKCRDKFSSWEIFFILYFGVLILFPGYQGFRYILPLLPFYLFYIFYVVSKLPFAVSGMFTGAFILSMIILYSNFYSTIPDKWAHYRMTQPLTFEAFDFIKTRLPEDVIVMATKPRLVSLYTDKRAVVYPDNPGNSFYENMQDHHVDYIFTSYIDKYQFPKQQAEADTSKFQKLFSNEQFAVYKLKNR